jgi:hypothetical protein
MTRKTFYLSLLTMIFAGCGSDNPAGSNAVDIPACDQYIAEYSACLEAVDEVNRPSLEAAFNNAVDEIKTRVENGEDKEQIADECQQKAEATRKAMSTYNCQFTVE